MTVAVDAVGTADLTAYPGGTSANFTNLTIGARLTNSALLVFIAFGNSTGPTGISVTWDGVARSPIAGASIAFGAPSEMQGYLYGLVNPHAGNKTLAVSWTGTSAYSIDAMSFSGVDQVNPFQNGTANGDGTTGTPSVTVTSAVGDYVFAGFASAATGTSTNQTQLFFDTGSSYPVASAAYAAGAATVTLTSDNGTGRFFAIGVDIKAAAAINLLLGNASTCARSSRPTSPRRRRPCLMVDKPVIRLAKMRAAWEFDSRRSNRMPASCGISTKCTLRHDPGLIVTSVDLQPCCHGDMQAETHTGGV